MRVVLKYHFPDRSMTVKLPPGSTVLSALALPFGGEESIFLVVEQEAHGAATEPRTFKAVLVGEEFSKRAMRFIDTVLLRRGIAMKPVRLLFSVFEELGS